MTAPDERDACACMTEEEHQAVHKVQTITVPEWDAYARSAFTRNWANALRLASWSPSSAPRWSQR